MVRYAVRPDQAEENTRLIEGVFDALSRGAPAGLTYASYRLDDGVSFVHVASVEDPANSPLSALDEFKRFTSGVKDRCEVMPVTAVLHQVGRYAGPPLTH